MPSGSATSFHGASESAAAFSHSAFAAGSAALARLSALANGRGWRLAVIERCPFVRGERPLFSGINAAIDELLEAGSAQPDEAVGRAIGGLNRKGRPEPPSSTREEKAQQSESGA